MLTVRTGGYGLTGPFPIELAHLPYLEVLDLQQNGLDSSLPPEFGLATDNHNQLRVLRLDQNQFTGSIPDEWCLLAQDSIQEINLGMNQLSGELPACFNNLAQLKDLNIMHNSFTGTIPRHWSSLVNMERFHFAHNELEGGVPGSFCEAKNLTELSADCLHNDAMDCACCTKCCDPVANVCELEGDE